MIRSILHPISKSGLFVSNLIASATGCFVFSRGFRSVAMSGERSCSPLPMRDNVGHSKSMAGISEAVATVLALRR